MKVKARIIRTAALVYPMMVDSNPSGELPIGQEIEMCSTHQKRGKTWVLIKSLDGTEGYISGDAPVFVINLASLDQDIEVRTEASKTSLVKMTLRKGMRFWVLDVIKQEEENWRRIRLLEDGTVGFIDGKTTLTYEPPPLDTDDVAKRNYRANKDIGRRLSRSSPGIKSSPYPVVIVFLLVVGLFGIVIHEYRTPVRNTEVGPPANPQNEDLLKAWDAGRDIMGVTYGMEESKVISLLGSPDAVIWPGQDNAREKPLDPLQAPLAPLQPGETYLVYRSHALKISNGKTNGEYRAKTITVYK